MIRKLWFGNYDRTETTVWFGTMENTPQKHVRFISKCLLPTQAIFNSHSSPIVNVWHQCARIFLRSWGIISDSAWLIRFLNLLATRNRTSLSPPHAVAFLFPRTPPTPTTQPPPHPQDEAFAVFVLNLLSRFPSVNLCVWCACSNRSFWILVSES